MATDGFKEEAYVLEKMEISEDDDDGFEYREIKDSEVEEIEDIAQESFGDEDDDLNDFNALKIKTEMKKAAELDKTGKGARLTDAVPKTLSRDVVIDDFIRNFMLKFKMTKTLNIFQQEWHEL
jgi:hypothetical protein